MVKDVHSCIRLQQDGLGRLDYVYRFGTAFSLPLTYRTALGANVVQFVTILTNGFLINAYKHGLGRHIYYLGQDDVQEAFKWLWAAEPTNLFAVYLVRLSISLFFLRLVPPRRAYIWLIWGTIVALTVSDIYISIDYFFQCRPIQKVWQPDVPGSCFDPQVTVVATWLYQG